MSPVVKYTTVGKPKTQESARGRAVQGARLRLWSRKRRGFKPHRTQIFVFEKGDLS